MDLEKNKKFMLGKVNDMIDYYSKKLEKDKASLEKSKNDPDLKKSVKEAEEELVKLKKRKAEIEGKKPEDNKKKPIEGLPPDSVIVFGKVIEKGKQVGYIENGKFMPGIRRS